MRKPTALAVDPDCIPDELKYGRQHVVWKYIERDGKWTKPPFQPNGSFAKSTDSSTWCTFPEAMAAYATGNFDGVGRVLNGDGIAGADFDHVLDPATRRVEQDADDYIKLLDTYSEISPSGCGLRAFFRGKIPPGHNVKAGVELYDSGRYLTLTGHRLHGLPFTVQPRQPQLDELIRRVFGNRAQRKGHRCGAPDVAEVEEALRFINSDPRETWFTIGAVLHRELGDAGRGIWDVWSRRSDKYSDLDQERTWCNFHADGSAAGAVGLGTLFKLAIDAGWHRNGASRARSSAGAQRAEQTVEGHEPQPPTPYSEIALSNRFAAERGADFHYTRGSWWRYDEAGGLWLNDETLRVFTEVKRFNTSIAREVCEAAASEDETTQKAARRFASELTTARKVAAVESLTRSDPAIVTTLDRFDRDIWMLNTRGGVVELRDGAMRPTRRDDFFTKSTLVAPREMPTPVFDQFIRDIMGAHVPPAICKCASCATSVGKPGAERQAMHDAEVQRLVEYSLRLYGYCLSGDVSEHILVMLVGDGGNGKTLLTDFIARDIFGLAPIGYSAWLPIEALLAYKGERHPTELMSLFHTRLALASEPSSGVSWNEGLVMRLTGGEPVTARGMRQDFVTFPGTHKLFVVANTAPTLRGGREPAWQRRLHMTLFQQRWADREDALNHVRLADASLREKLRPEAPGVLHKLILGCVEYVRRGKLDPPATIRQTSDNYLKQQNVIGRWLDERCDRSNPHATATVADLWTDLTRWGEAGREYIGTRNDFNGALERLGIVITRMGTQRGICHGLRLLPPGVEAS